MRTAGPFNAINNTLDGYETNCTDHWRYIKIPLQGRRRYLKETLTSQSQSQWLEFKATYINPITLPAKGMDNIDTKIKILIVIPYYFVSFNNSVLTSASEALWQTPHRWSPLQKKFPYLYRYPSGNSDPSGYVLLDWRSHASLVIIWNPIKLNYNFYKFMLKSQGIFHGHSKLASWAISNYVTVHQSLKVLI